MKKNALWAIVILLSSVLFFSACENDVGEYILIYNGAPADAEGFKAVARAAEELGYKVEYISNLRNLPDMLKNAKAFVIGATDGDTGDILVPLRDVQDDLKEYISNGGRYMGICGGAYIASKGSQWDDGYEEGISLVDTESFKYDPDYNDAQVITVTWLGSQRSIYYLNGPAFKEEELPAETRTLAYYTDENKSVAAFITDYGDGKIALCGPHPEADDTWLIDSPKPLNSEQWTETWDLFLGMFEDLLAESSQKN